VTWHVKEFDEIDSTNTYLVEAARSGAPSGTVARADFQRAGRGRLTRTWEAPARSGLLVSILLRPNLAANELHRVTAAVALSARAALTRLCGLRPDLKWPNDLIVDDRKIGGILAEAVASPNGELAVVVGLGLNLTSEGPPEANGTSVRRETGITIDPRAALDALLEELDWRVELLGDAEKATLRDEYVGALSTIGAQVRVELADGRAIEGTAVGVDEDGRLEVEAGTERVTVGVGDVVHLRRVES
jgi:BirA family biotin operon repressor/biotin-[acetyl-CoA-carboxylase] ligase